MSSRQTRGYDLQFQREEIAAKFGPIPAELWFQDEKPNTKFKRPGLDRLCDYCRRHPQPDTPGEICMRNPTKFCVAMDDETRVERGYRIELLRRWGWVLRCVDEPPPIDLEEFRRRFPERYAKHLEIWRRVEERLGAEEADPRGS